ncbi:unnamed protein product [Rotaria sp. Silwood2]|nr:unnamed protein product [Rotaria sp. Silwood2]CAF4405159.1 unnamed protein product [Rotaria sp. Silwood2]
MYIISPSSLKSGNAYNGDIDGSHFLSSLYKLLFKFVVIFELDSINSRISTAFYIRSRSAIEHRYLFPIAAISPDLSLDSHTGSFIFALSMVNKKSVHESNPSQRRLRSKVVGGKVSKKNEFKVRKLIKKKKNSKSTLNNSSMQSANSQSPEKCLQVNTHENCIMDSSIATPSVLFIDEDITFYDNESNKNNPTNESDTRMELSFNNEEKTNDLVCLSTVPKVNSTEAFKTSNVKQSISDVSMDEEKIHRLLSKAIFSTAADGDNSATNITDPNNNGLVLVNQNVEKKDTTDHQSQRYSNNDGLLNSSLTQATRQKVTPHVIRTTSLSSCITKSPSVRSQHHDVVHKNAMSHQVKQNIMLLQALPEYRSLEREVKTLKKQVEEWSHNYTRLERKYDELKANSFPRPSADGYEFLKQLLDCLTGTSSDIDTRTNLQLATDLNLTLEQLIAAEHEDPQRTTLNILNILCPTNSDKADLVSIREMVKNYNDVLQTIYIIARRSSPNTSFSMRQLRNAIGMSIRQARYRESLSNKNILLLGEKLKETTSENNSSNNDTTKYFNKVQYNDNEISSEHDIDLNGDLDDE